jgi:hypothetical protein
MSIRWLTIFLDHPGADQERAENFWLEVTATRLSARRGPGGEFATALPTHGDAYLRFQRVQDGPGGCHLDLHVDLDRRSLADIADHAVSLGARLRHVEDGLTVLDSPGGFTFCLVAWAGESVVPDPVRVDAGGANRLDQLCLDIPPSRFESERGFWSMLTGWPWRAAQLPEFSYLEGPAGLPVRLLFQRLQAGADPLETVSAHVDFAGGDFAALTERHEAAGARVLARYPYWTTLADPVGRVYCLTHRRP